VIINLQQFPYTLGQAIHLHVHVYACQSVVNVGGACLVAENNTLRVYRP
jgi:hypothetical protein